MTADILNVQGVSKAFPGVQALNKVNLVVKKGEVHCLVGENGAGKSTLVKILAGIYQKDEGIVLFDGREVCIEGIHEAQQMGISFIFQELSIVDSLTVEENITLGSEESRWGFVARRKNRQRVKQVFSELGIDSIHSEEAVKCLSASKKQMVLIAKAFSHNSRLIVMDEPTAALSGIEVEKLFAMIRTLKERGISVIFISHKFDDIFAIGDRITVFRDGLEVGRRVVAETTKDEIVRMMVGREIDCPQIEPCSSCGVNIQAEALTAKKVIRDVSFSVFRGEIFGVAGLEGAGKTELAKALYGANQIVDGRLLVEEKAVSIKSPRDAIAAGIFLVPEERRSEGIVEKMSVTDNMVLSCLSRLSRFTVVDRKKTKRVAAEYIDKLQIKTPSSDTHIRLLSGGNQQKVVIGKCLNLSSDIILLDEPTRGIDIGAKNEIYKLILDLAISGKTVLVFSSELPELFILCNRIMVLRDGMNAGILPRERFSQECIMRLAMGLGEDENENS